MKILAVGDLVGNIRNIRIKKEIKKYKRKRTNRFYNSKCGKCSRRNGNNTK